MIAIIDYGAGNLRSVEKAFQKLGYNAEVTSDKKKIHSADRVVLPGVGAFGSAVQGLMDTGLAEVIHEAVGSGRPFLGICLGLQLMFESSEESTGIPGLGILKGRILRIPQNDGYKIPHIGWNEIEINKECPLFKGIDNKSYVYFVHSYYLKAEDRSIVSATVDYGAELEVAVWHENVFLTQFHPEKSGDTGLKMLKNFVENC